jgi:hypothetical protein
VVGELAYGRVERVSGEGAARTAVGRIRAEHEVIDEQLGAPVEELGERLGAGFSVEGVFGLDWNPRQRLALLGKLIAELRQLLLALEQLAPRDQPLLPGSDLVLRHRVPPRRGGYQYNRVCASKSPLARTAPV